MESERSLASRWRARFAVEEERPGDGECQVMYAVGGRRYVVAGWPAAVLQVLLVVGLVLLGRLTA